MAINPFQSLQTLYVPKIMSNVSVGDIVSVDATLTYEAPTDNLHVFHGKLELHKDDQNIGNGHLSIDNLLLRGVKLKDTDFVIGCVIYTGQDTKLSLNSKVGKPKVSTSDRSISKFLIMTVVAMVVMILFSSVRKMIHDLKNPWILAFVQKREVVPYIDLVTNALQFMIIFQHMIPISLPVTIGKDIPKKSNKKSENVHCRAAKIFRCLVLHLGSGYVRREERPTCDSQHFRPERRTWPSGIFAERQDWHVDGQRDDFSSMLPRWKGVSGEGL